MEFDVEKIRKDFPALSERTNGGNTLIYFDNAASAQKPLSVLEAVSNFYRHDYSNIHRSAHDLSMRATAAYENARKKVLGFFSAPPGFEAVFTRGTTESLNLIAQSWAQSNLRRGDEILLTEMEHHANIVPWQIAAQKTGAKISVAKILPDGSLNIEDFKEKLSGKTKIVSIAHASNVLGTVNPVKLLSGLAHSAGALVSIDAAQSSPHMLDNLSDIGADFYSVSSHKCFGPTGCGALIARRDLLDAMPPYQCGGDMIENVSWEGTTFRKSPERFEAGTPNIAGAIGFAAALDYLKNLDAAAAGKHEKNLLIRLSDGISSIGGTRIYGNAQGKLPIVSFNLSGAHPNDISALLNAGGIAIRTGHHCAEPLMETLGIRGTCRASLAFYNTKEEVDIFVEKLAHAAKILA